MDLQANLGLRETKGQLLLPVERKYWCGRTWFNWEWDEPSACAFVWRDMLAYTSKVKEEKTNGDWLTVELTAAILWNVWW